MFRVDVESLEEYFDFDPSRKGDLVKLDALIAKAAPALKRHFHAGTPAGEAGMRMKMIGYGRFRFAIKSGETVDWPVIGVALQKNYISVYLSIAKDGAPILRAPAGALGARRVGNNNFSFGKYEELDAGAAARLFAEAARIFEADPGNPARYRQSA
jgi:hypothetical protein